MWIALKCVLCGQLGGIAQHSKTKAAFVAWTNNGIAEIYTEIGTFCSYQMAVSKVLIPQVSFEQWFQRSQWCELQYCSSCTKCSTTLHFVFVQSSLYTTIQQWKKPLTLTRKCKMSNKSDAYSKKEKEKKRQGAVYPTICSHMYCMLVLLSNGKDYSCKPINRWHC